MQKRYSFLVLLALPLFLHSQNPIAARQRVAITAAPNISYVTPNGSADIQMPRLGFHARLDGEWRLKQRLWLRIGAGYTLMQYKKDVGQSLQWPSQNNGNGQFDPSLPGESRQVLVLNEAKMLTIPVALRYYMDKKQRFYADVASGASLIFLQYSDIVRPHFGTALGFQFVVLRQNWLFVQPSFRLVLDNQSYTFLKSKKSYPYSFSLEMGMRRNLR